MSRIGHFPNNKMAITGRNAWLCCMVSEQCIHEFYMFIFLDTSWWLRSGASFKLPSAGNSQRRSAAITKTFVSTPNKSKGKCVSFSGGRWKGSFWGVKDNFMSLTMFHLKLCNGSSLQSSSPQSTLWSLLQRSSTTGRFALFNEVKGSRDKKSLSVLILNTWKLSPASEAELPHCWVTNWRSPHCCLSRFMDLKFRLQCPDFKKKWQYTPYSECPMAWWLGSVLWSRSRGLELYHPRRSRGQLFYLGKYHNLQVTV